MPYKLQFCKVIQVGSDNAIQQVKTGKIASGNLVYSEGFEPCIAVFMQTKKGQGIIYHATDHIANEQAMQFVASMNAPIEEENMWW